MRLGPELVTNGDFKSAEGWTAGVGWTIDTISGKAVYSKPENAPTDNLQRTVDLLPDTDYLLGARVSNLSIPDQEISDFVAVHLTSGTEGLESGIFLHFAGYRFVMFHTNPSFEGSPPPQLRISPSFLMEDKAVSFEITDITLRQVLAGAEPEGLPIIERIARDIENAVNEVTTENGYSQTLTAVRPRRLDFDGILLNDGKVFIWQGDLLPVGEPANLAAEWNAEFQIGAILIDSDTETDSIDIRLNAAAADLQKQLLADPSRGGWAIDSAITGVSKIDAEECTGVSVALQVHYRTKYDDPYSKV